MSVGWYEAIMNGDFEATKVAIRAAESLVHTHQGGTILWSPLEIAIIHRRHEILHWLLTERIVSADTADDSSSTALHMAARGNDVKVVHLLLSVGGASVDPHNKVGGTPLSQAAQLRNSETYARPVCWMLIQRGAKWPTPARGVPPDWICEMYEARKRRLKAALIMVGIGKFNRSPLIRGRDMWVLLARAMLVESRADPEAWIEMKPIE